jgi:transposase
MMMTIAWNPLGFQILDALLKDNTLNADYYRANILTDLLPLHPQINGRRSVLQADNARPHTAQKCRIFCEENRLRLAVYPPCSPDLAPSDFFLFQHIKHYLQGIAFPSHNGLLAAIYEIFRAIPRPTLEDMFRHWIERLE